MGAGDGELGDDPARTLAGLVPDDVRSDDPLELVRRIVAAVATEAASFTNKRASGTGPNAS